MKFFFATFLFVSLVLSSSFVQLSFAIPVVPTPTPAAPVPPPSPAPPSNVLSLYKSFPCMHLTFAIRNFLGLISLTKWMVLCFFFFFWQKGVCDSKCGERCSKAGIKDRCLKYCGICCRECNCVPSGTYGNKSECPCYRDKLNSKGKPKCPWEFSRVAPNSTPSSAFLLSHSLPILVQFMCVGFATFGCLLSSHPPLLGNAIYYSSSSINYI